MILPDKGNYYEPGTINILILIGDVTRKGISHVHLVPLMLVAGVHLAEDIAGGEDSWKSVFESNGVTVSFDSQGLGKERGIVDMFIRHIAEALSMIP